MEKELIPGRYNLVIVGTGNEDCNSFRKALAFFKEYPKTVNVIPISLSHESSTEAFASARKLIADATVNTSECTTLFMLGHFSGQVHDDFHFAGEEAVAFLATHHHHKGRGVVAIDPHYQNRKLFLDYKINHKKYVSFCHTIEDALQNVTKVMDREESEHLALFETSTHKYPRLHADVNVDTDFENLEDTDLDEGVLS